jgi:hypothetical protein
MRSSLPQLRHPSARDIGKRIALHRDDVSGLAGGDRAAQFRASDEISGVDGGRLNASRPRGPMPLSKPTRKYYGSACLCGAGWLRELSFGRSGDAERVAIVKRGRLRNTVYLQISI